MDWYCTAVLSINSTKPELVYFFRRRNLNLKRISFLVEVPDWSIIVKYLGIILDNKLRWNEYVQAILKTTKALMVCRRVAGSNRGYTPKTAPDIDHDGYGFRSRIRYGYRLSGLRADVREAFTKVQRLACLCITGAMRSCPTVALEIIIELNPLHLVVERHAVLATICLVLGRP